MFGIECALDELARTLKLDPFELRRRNIVIPGNPLLASSAHRDDLMFGSYGLDQWLDLAQAALGRGNGVTAPAGLAGGPIRDATGIPTPMSCQCRLTAYGGWSRIVEVWEH